MFITHIKLPRKQDADAFVAFMQEEYFPAVRKDALRIGQVTSLLLLQGNTTETVDEFFLQAREVLSKPRVDDENVRRKFDSFEAKVDELGTFSEAAEWSAPQRAAARNG